MATTDFTEWKGRIGSAKYYPNAGRSGQFAVRIHLGGLEEQEGPKFVKALNTALAETADGDDNLKIKFGLEQNTQSKYRACTAKFHYFDQAEQCLRRVEKCGLATEDEISHDAREYGTRHDKWMRSTTVLQRTFGYGATRPEFYQPEPQSRTNLTGSDDTAEEAAPRPCTKKDTPSELKGWSSFVGTAELRYNTTSRGGFAIRIELDRLTPEEATTFVGILNNELATATVDGKKFKPRFKLEDKHQERYRRCVMQFDRFADAEACLGLIKTCGLNANRNINDEMRQFGTERDKWLDIPWTTRMWNNIPEPERIQPSFTPRINLVTGEVADGDGEHSPSSRHRNDQDRRRGDRGRDSGNAR